MTRAIHEHQVIKFQQIFSIICYNFQATFACEAQHSALGAHNSPMRVTVVLSVLCKLHFNIACVLGPIL
jgi:hypothetical protein